MERPRTSHYERRSITTLWRPKTGQGTQQGSGRDNATKMSSQPTSAPYLKQDTLETRRGGASENSWYETDFNGEPCVGPSRRPSGAESAPKENKTVGRQPSRRERLSSLFLPKLKERAAMQEERLGNAKHSHTGSWLRRAKSTTLRIGRKPLLEHCEPQEADDLEHIAAEAHLMSEHSIDPTRLHGGAAARASAAAASRERFEFSRSPIQKDLSKIKDADLSTDSESGIGIDLKDSSDHASDTGSSTLPRLDPASLPPELFDHVISYLDALSVMHAELVSRKWLETAGSYRTWRGLFGTDFNDKRSVSRRVALNVGGFGLGSAVRAQDWKQMWKSRMALDARWRDGYAAAIYLEGHRDSVYCVQFDEDKIITGSRDRTIRVWDTHTYRCIKVLGNPKSTPANQNSTPIGSRMSRQKPFCSVTPLKPQIKPQAQSKPMNHAGSVLCLQFDATTMVTGSSDTTLIIWDITSDYQPTHRLERHNAGVLDVCFDNEHIVSCSKDTTICLWERSTGSLVRTFNGHRGPVNAVQLRGAHMVSASGDGVAKLWNIASGNCVKEFPSKDRGLACVEFSPDSRTILAGGNDQVIYQFDANTGELVRELSGHGGLVRSLHLDSVNGRVISGSYDYSVKAFDIQSGKMLCDFAGWTTSWMLSAKADYRRIVATSQDGRAVVMDFGYGLRGVELLECGKRRCEL